MLGDMFSNMDFGSLDEETRLALANYLDRRNEYLVHLQELNSRRIAALMSPSQEADRELAEYSSAVVAPVRAKLSEEMASLLGAAVDVEALQALLPAILMGVSRSINFPVLFTVLGLDPDMIAQATGSMKDYFSDHMG